MALGFVMLYKLRTQCGDNGNSRCIFAKQFCSSCCASFYAYFAAGHVMVVYFTPEEVYDAVTNRKHSVAVAS